VRQQTPHGKKGLADQTIPKLRGIEFEAESDKTIAESVTKIRITEQNQFLGRGMWMQLPAPE
jgi:hypothetical protein